MDSLGRDGFEDLFPTLKTTGFDISSEASAAYNCVAFAAGVTDVWWEPIAPPKLGYFWPTNIPQNDGIPAAEALFRSLGYEPCENGDPEPGFVKVAVYGEDGAFTHVTRQTEDGRWLSKIGAFEDITHPTLDGLLGEKGGHGVVVLILKKSLSKVPAAALPTDPGPPPATP